MVSDAESVDQFLKSVPEQRRAALERIRSLIRQTHPTHEETMEYGMPSYKTDGVVELAFNSQQQHISVYLLKEGVIDAYRDKFAKSAMGKGCIRYRNPARIDFELMREMLLAHATSKMPPC